MKKHMTLGQLIDTLERKEPADRIQYDFGYFYPTEFGSWRGDYSCLSLGYEHVEKLDREKLPTVESLLKLAKEADGKEYVGYKGGEFRMDRDKAIWVANVGESCNSGVVDVIEREGGIYLSTDVCTYLGW